MLPLFNDQAKFEPSVDGQKLEMEDILVYYVDEEAPTFTMKRLTGGVIAVIVVVILAVAAGLLVLYLKRRRERGYSKAEVSGPICLIDLKSLKCVKWSWVLLTQPSVITTVSNHQIILTC